MIKIVNKYKEPNHIYCGRGSTLGNPYTFSAKGTNHKALYKVDSRDEACDKYEEYFHQKVVIEKDEAMLN